jgi:hypothetical protein
MTVIKRIGPGSAFKVGLVVYALLGLVIGMFVSLGALVGVAIIPGAPPRTGLFGVFAILFLPILYGIFGGLFAAISALVYNFAAGWVGGLEMDIS